VEIGKKIGSIHIAGFSQGYYSIGQKTG